MKVTTRRKSAFTIIELGGYLNFETANRLGEEIEKFFDENESRVVFDLRGLEFVGSSGVSSFVKMLSEYNFRNNKPVYCGVKKEFVKLFKVFEGETPFNVVESSADDFMIADTQKPIL